MAHSPPCTYSRGSFPILAPDTRILAATLQVTEAQLEGVLAKMYGEEEEDGHGGDVAEMAAARQYLCSVIAMLGGSAPQAAQGEGTAKSPATAVTDSLTPAKRAPSETASPVNCRSPLLDPGAAQQARLSLLASAGERRRSPRPVVPGSPGMRRSAPAGPFARRAGNGAPTSPTSQLRGEDDYAKAGAAAAEVSAAIAGLREVRASLGQLLPGKENKVPPGKGRAAPPSAPSTHTHTHTRTYVRTQIHHIASLPPSRFFYPVYLTAILTPSPLLPSV